MTNKIVLKHELKELDETIVRIDESLKNDDFLEALSHLSVGIERTVMLLAIGMLDIDDCFNLQASLCGAYTSLRETYIKEIFKG